jgi:hypothetical protein
MRSSRSLQMKFKASVLFAAVALCAFFVLAAGAFADGPGDRKKPGKPARPATEEKKDEPKKKDETEKKEESWLALTGGDVYTVTGPVLRKATVLVKDGKVVALGRELTIPEGTETIDVAGMRVYPGLVAVSSSRIIGREPPENSTDVYGTNMILGLSAGLTTVVTGNTAAKLTYGTVDDMVLRRNIFTTLRYTRRSPMQRREMRVDMEKVRQYLRDLEAYGDAKSRGDKEAKEPDKKWLRGKYTTYLSLLKGEITALISADNMQDLRDAADLSQRFGFRLVIRGGIEAWSVASELGRKGVSVILTPRRKPRGGMYGNDRGEGGIDVKDNVDPSWGSAEPEHDGESLAAEENGHPSHEHDDANCPVCSGGAPLEGAKKPFMEGEDEHLEVDAPLELASWGESRLLRPNGWTIENARILFDSGVPFAIIPQSSGISLGGITGRDLLMMPMEAAFAVRGGLSEAAAIESITIDAARLLGIDHRVGSIEVGKDADLIVCDGDLLHYKTMVQWSIVNGRLVYDKEKESLFGHIRPRGKAGTEPHPEYWPREFGEMPGYKPEVEPPLPGEETPDPEKPEAEGAGAEKSTEEGVRKDSPPKPEKGAEK